MFLKNLTDSIKNVILSIDLILIILSYCICEIYFKRRISYYMLNQMHIKFARKFDVDFQTLNFSDVPNAQLSERDRATSHAICDSQQWTKMMSEEESLNGLSIL